MRDWDISKCVIVWFHGFSSKATHALCMLFPGPASPRTCLLGVQRVGLRTQTTSGGAGAVEVTSESRNQEGAEDDVGATSI